VTPLDEYRRRRHASRTPEPTAAGEPRDGGHAAASWGPLFVVQRHAARRLHYDLRLERDGVLASWAVPRGLPITRGARHLAVKVEDHPREYATFSGDIPAGEYGAGHVDIWDTGTFQMLHEGRDGHLTVRLEGARAQGTWKLIPASLDGDPRNWLLMRADEAAPRKRTMPSPMLATPGRVPTASDVWRHEVKWDGYRMIARIEGGVATLRSRNGLDITARFRRVADALGRAVRTPDCVLDGELVALDPSGAPSFSLLQARTGEQVVYLFDLLEEDGHDMTGRPWRARRAALNTLVPDGHPVVRLSADFPDGDALFREVAAAGLEGVVCKREDAPYQPGQRSAAWVKVRATQRGRFIVVGFRPVRGARRGVGSLMLATDDGASLTWMGNCGSGISAADSDALEHALAPLIAERPALREAPRDLTRDRDIRWVVPRVQVHVRFGETTAAGRLRQSVFEGLADRLPDPSPRPPVRVTRREKVMFPDDGVTKGDLLDYYAAVAHLMVPHLIDRPLTLIRYPDGIAGDHFYQRNRPRGMPEWIRSMRVPLGDEPGAKSVDAPIVDGPEALRWMVNAGCIDLNPWIATATDPSHPDLMLFDLDPSGDDGLVSASRAALLVRDVLASVGLESVPKVSSAAGMHVVAPVQPLLTHRDLRAACRLVATAIERAHPGEVTTEWRKDRRVGVLVDCNQVGQGRSISAVWSVRPRPGAPVAIPLEWDEVEAGVDPAELTMDRALRRAEERGDLFARALVHDQVFAPDGGG
jgi:bifunctional non-homologous end joining protein LigD